MNASAKEKGHRLILAEDDTDMRDILSFWLEGEGYTVISVPNGWEAIRAAKKERPSVVVLDLLMPGVDGYQACRYLRHDPELYDVPIVLFSAVFVDEEERQLGFDVGADDFVMKTSGFNSLLTAIDRVVGDSSGRRRHEPVDEETALLVRQEIESAVGAPRET